MDLKALESLIFLFNLQKDLTNSLSSDRHLDKHPLSDCIDLNKYNSEESLYNQMDEMSSNIGESIAGYEKEIQDHELEMFKIERKIEKLNKIKHHALNVMRGIVAGDMSSPNKIETKTKSI